ncbi:uncharacterized protein LOC113360435 [Papaver somniferum]|uniref:uncharacterized protein LOC113360435 n=1 Tax=Papaver somniferum TaxID=3469 RepID=UPI000E6F8015|nr:uncharacterized protein LOC113360435 [Papaver somniferum]
MSEIRDNQSSETDSRSQTKSDDKSEKNLEEFLPFIPDEDIDESLDEWKFSLIGRLDLVHFKFAIVESSLRRQWGISGKVQLIPIGKGYFIIKLENESDMKYIWDGDWFPGLSIEYWKEKILLHIGKSLGRPIKADENTLKKDVGYYASILVEMDLAKEIPSKICVESKYGKFEQIVNIPNRPKFCYHCKIVGHLTAECRNKKREQNKDEVTADFPKEQKKVWRKVTPKRKTQIPFGFDICFPTNDVGEPSTHASHSSNTNQEYNPSIINSSATNKEQNANSGKFHVLQNMSEESINSHVVFPTLSLENILSNAASAPSVS